MGPMLPRISLPSVPERVLVIPDMHFPWEHTSAFEFLKEIKKTFQPDLVINLGDEVDWHSLNFHGTSPDLVSNKDEIKLIRSKTRELERIFPKMLLCESNHGMLPFRRAFAAGLSRHLVMPYDAILGVGPGWRWAKEIMLGNRLLIRHQFGKNISLCAKRYGISLIQGHFHENQELHFFEVGSRSYFAASVGCLINKDHEAFAYSHNNIFRPRLGVLLIKNGVPKLVPMRCYGKSNEWDGELSYV